jgi:hypothetical protein
MKVSNKVFYTWAWFHIGYIICICSYSAYDKYCKFYRLTESHAINKINTNVLINKPMVLYGKFTGTSMGYGFFAPNIKSGGIILGDCDGKKIGPVFANFEAMMRFSVLATRITDYLVNPADSTGIRDSAMRDKYYSLIFKSIAVKIYAQNHCARDTAYLSYNIFEFPTLAAYRLGARNYSLRKIKEVRLVKQSK